MAIYKEYLVNLNRDRFKLLEKGLLLYTIVTLIQVVINLFDYQQNGT